MDFELRSVLLIIGVVVITAILIHGLIGIRRANKPVDISHIDLQETDEEGNLLRDGSGFDRHGVGVVRKKGVGATQAQEAAIPKVEVEVKQPEADETSTEFQPDVNEDSALDTAINENEQGINFSVALESDKTMLGDSQPLDVEEQDSPVFESPIAQEKEDFLAPKITVTPVPEPSEPVLSSSDSMSEEPCEPMDVLVFNVVPAEDEEISGAQLLPTLLTLGLKFGDMDIFHRHQEANGNGDVLFSLVNMVKPGTFDIDNMEQFTTSGISLFMTIPHKHGNMESFNMMLNAAAKIAESFGGQVLDGDRSTLTKQSTQHYVQRIREVERKMLLVK